MDDVQEAAKILLHADNPLSKETAERINEAVGKIGPIQVAGMGLAMTMEKTAIALKDGLEKVKIAEKEFENEIHPEIMEAVKEGAETEAELELLRAERDQLAEMNAYHRAEVIKGNEYREKLKETIVSLHDRLHEKNQRIDNLVHLAESLEAELERANRVIDAMTREAIAKEGNEAKK